MMMKVIFISLILALVIAQVYPKDLDHCFQELNKELEEEEKKLNLVYEKELETPIEMFDMFGLIRKIQWLLQACTASMGYMMYSMATIMRDMMSPGKTVDVQRDEILHNIITKMISVFEPFLQSSKKFTTILNKFYSIYTPN